MNRQILPVAAVILSLACGTIACDAFSDRDVEHEVLSSLNLLPVGGETGGSGGGESPKPSESAPLCKAASNVNVTVSDKQSIQANSGWTAMGEVSATAAGDKTTTVKISGTTASLSFTLQKSDKSFSVCNVSYTAAPPTATPAPAAPVVKADAQPAGETYALTGGTVMVDQFNVKSSDGKKVVNAGSYLFTFKKGTDAAKAVEILVSGKAAGENDATRLEGTYYTEKLGTAAATK